jgi:hypothetical protein
VRIETSDAPAGFFLNDGRPGDSEPSTGGPSNGRPSGVRPSGDGTADFLFVRVTQRDFMDAKQSTRLTQVFVRVDPRDPCPRWQAAAHSAGLSDTDGWRCGRPEAGGIDEAGKDEYPGAIEYSVDLPKQASSRRWVDPVLEFPVKLRTADGTMVALEHIRIGAQPASLFAVPPGYRRSDPQLLIERMKHSDVWAGPPN